MLVAKKAVVSVATHIIGVFLLSLGFVSPGVTAEINTLSAYTSYPPFLTAKTSPNVIFALDISGSMKQSAYSEPGIPWRTGIQTDFNPTNNYFGYFDQDSRYLYDSDKQFFYADPNGDWSGRFLNWASMRRIDVARKVVVGGKVSVLTLDQDPDSPTYNQSVYVNRNKAIGFTNWQDNSWDQWYVLEGQDEPEDYQFYKQYSANTTEGHTPAAITDGTIFKIAKQRLIPISSAGGSAIPLSGQVEIGQLTMDWNAGDEWLWVPFVNSYNQPRVVVKTQSFNGDDALTEPRIKLKNGWNGTDNDGFYVRLQEWDYLDGNHVAETFAYMVVESKTAAGTALGCVDVADDQGGVWQFCADADAAPVNSANCGVPNDAATVVAQQVNWDAESPRSKPIVFSGITTWDATGDTDATNVRSYAANTSSVQVFIQEQELNGGNSSCVHSSVEQIATLAIVPPNGISEPTAASWTYAGQSIRIQSGVLSRVTQDISTLEYPGSQLFNQAPIFISGLQSFNHADPVTIRVSGATANSIDLRLHEETSSDLEVTTLGEDVGWLAVEFTAGFAIRVGVQEEPIGLVQKAAGSMRLGLAVYNYDHDLAPRDIYTGNKVHGGTLFPCYPDTNLAAADQTTTDICLSTGVHDPVENLIQVVEEHPLIWGSTPIAETLVEIKNYLQQNSNSGVGYYEDKSPQPTYPFGIVDGVPQDPYHYQDAASMLDAKLDCAKTFVLHINDGEPFADWDGSGHPAVTGDGVGDTGENEMLDDVAFSLRHEDLRTDDELPGHQEVISYYVLAALGDSEASQYSTATRRLREAAINGGFAADNDDLDENHRPDPPHPTNVNQYIQDNIDPVTGLPDCSDQLNEWDADGDCNPDTFYYANDGFELEEQLAAAFLSIGKRSSSGTAASVVSNTRTGTGAIYQSIFFPEYDDKQGHLVDWAGQLHALLVDDYGNMREDTEKNGKLDIGKDRFIEFYTDEEEGLMVKKYPDGIELADGTQIPANGKLDDYELEKPVGASKLEDLSFLWNSSDWLNSTDLLAGQRTFADSAAQRYIFTSLADGATVDFDSYSAAVMLPYLHVAEPFSFSAEKPPWGVAPTDFTTFLARQSERLIKWVRGEDQAADSIGSAALPAMRSRQYLDSNSGESRTWRLGDIVTSTPTVVGRPAENFDLLYRDSSYSKFYARYRNRRNVVYVGANDGMFHAFNAGFYHSASKGYLLQPRKFDGTPDTGITQFPLGAEIWAYVPHNLLPHLYWLTRPDYTHVYYNDLKPKVFDAKIFPDDALTTNRHPGGWGTILVSGMRLGGGAINADLDQNGQLDATDPLLQSAFYIFDITDPEVPPALLAEIALPDLGFTTSYPTVITMNDSDDNTSANYLVIGSGPAGLTGVADSQALQEMASRQPGRVYLLNLNKLTDGSEQLCFIDASGNCNAADAAPQPLVVLDEDSFISQPITVDWDLDYNADAVYFGTVSGNKTAGWGGKFRRIVIDDDPVVKNWETDSVFLDLSVGEITEKYDGAAVATGQPITAAASAGLQKRGGIVERWLYFGTGRYLTVDDTENGEQQSYYGLKEPKGLGLDLNIKWTYGSLTRAALLDVSKARVYEGGGEVKDVAGVSSFPTLLAKIDMEKPGWLLNFADFKERNTGQAALLGNVLTFTSFIPHQAPCDTSGYSWLYALDYRTGTANSLPILGTRADDTTDEGLERNKKREEIGSGISSSPGIHTGRQKGSKVFMQSSSGAITAIEQQHSGPTKSGMTSWEVEE